MPETLASQVAALTAILTRMERRSDDDRKALADDRRGAELARSAVSAELTDIRHGQTDVLRRLGRIEPVTDLVTSVRSKIIGAGIVLGVLGAVAWAGFQFFKDVILEWFK